MKTILFQLCPGSSFCAPPFVRSRSFRGLFARGIAVLVMMGAVLFQTASARAANILWVSDFFTDNSFSAPGTGVNDTNFITILQSAGHNVFRFNPPASQNTALTPAQIAAINTNDLIIIGRASDSAAYQAGVQANQWNTNITKPMIVQSSYLLRNSRMGWFTGETVPDSVPGPMNAVNLSDPETAYLFGTVALSGNNTVDPFEVAVDRNTSLFTSAPVAGGTILARTVSGTVGSVIVEFPAGTVVRSGTNILAGYRMFFGSGSREAASPGGVANSGKDNLTATGKAIFLRAVELALNNGNLPNPPSAPADLSGLSLSGQVQLKWSAASAASGYYIKRSLVGGGPYDNIATNASSTNYTDTSVVNDTTYYYVVSAFNAAGESANTLEIAVTPKDAPGNVTAVGGTNQVIISWDALAGAASYTVKRSASSGGPFSSVASGITDTSYTDTTAGAGQTFYYVVVGQLTLGGDSGQSSTVSATTAPSASTINSVVFATTVLRVGWTSGGQVVSQYLLETSPDGVNFSPLAILPGTALSFTNSGLSLDTVYAYRVQATNAGGLSAYSNITTNRTPAGGYNINISNSANSSQNPTPAPAPPGYVVDEGEVFGDRGNGFSYGWTTVGGTNITRDSRWRQSALSPDLRYDTGNQFMKNNVNNPATSAIWDFQLPNGFYQVRVVGGDADAFDSTFQFNVEGVNSPTFPASTGVRWADYTTDVSVSDGRLTITSGPQAINNKLCFVDIYPAVAIAPVISGQPQSQAVEENRPVTLSVTISAGSPTLFYQWYFNDIPLPDATNQTLVFPHIPTSAQGDYYLIVTNYGGAATSTVATVTVSEDVTAPSIVSVGSLDGLTIGVCFDEELNAIAIGDAANYVVNGDVTPTNVIVRLDGRSVALQLATPISGPFIVQVFSLPDLADNFLFEGGTNSVVLGLSTGDIGNPLRLGSHYTCDNETIEIVGGGTDIWNAADQFHYVWQSIAGDFDASVRVTSLAGANNITKAGIVARESTNASSPGLHVTVNPLPPGRDLAQMTLRLTQGAISATVGSNIAPGAIPNAWLRLQRAGTNFTGYHSTNGSNWTVMGQTNVPLGSPLVLGLGVSAHDTNLLATGIFSNFRVTTESAAIALTDATFTNGTFSASFQSAAGVNYQVQYRTNLPPQCAPGSQTCPPDTDVWTLLLTIPGDGTVKTFTDPTIPLPDRRFYRVAFVP